MYKLLSILLFAYGLALTTDEIYDNSWALIIGINKYENVQKLDFAADDAIAMKEILIESFNFPEENVTMLLNQEATKDNIVKEFSNIAFKAQERDRVLVFFAGHGETMELPEGGQMGYLIPVNGDADNLYYSSIAMDELKRLALMSKAKHMLYLVDACYGGIAAVGSRGLSTNAPNYIDKIISGKSRQIITAGGKGEQVIEKSEWGHSAFTLNLKRGLKDKRADLNSDGYITANELGMFLSERVTIDSDNQQTPQYGRMTSQEGEFVFVYSEDTIITQVKDSTPRDEQLDFILKELKQLKSQQSSNESNSRQPVKELDNKIPKIGQSYQYWQRERGVGFITSPTMTMLELYNIVNDHLEYSLQYNHSRNKIFSSLISNTHSNEMHQYQSSIIYSRVLKERYRMFIGGGLGFAKVIWTDSSLNLENAFNYFKTSLIGGVGVKLIKIAKPISTQLGFKILVELTDQPTYELDQSGKTIFDHALVIDPKFIFLISFPK